MPRLLNPREFRPLLPKTIRPRPARATRRRLATRRRRQKTIQSVTLSACRLALHSPLPRTIRRRRTRSLLCPPAFQPRARGMVRWGRRSASLPESLLQRPRTIRPRQLRPSLNRPEFRRYRPRTIHRPRAPALRLRPAIRRLRRKILLSALWLGCPLGFRSPQPSIIRPQPTRRLRNPPEFQPRLRRMLRPAHRLASPLDSRSLQ